MRQARSPALSRAMQGAWLRETWDGQLLSQPDSFGSHSAAAAHTAMREQFEAAGVDLQDAVDEDKDGAGDFVVEIRKTFVIYLRHVDADAVDHPEKGGS